MFGCLFKSVNFIANQFIKTGYVVADLELEFDKQGNIKNNYKLNGIFNNGNVTCLTSLQSTPCCFRGGSFNVHKYVRNETILIENDLSTYVSVIFGSVSK